MSRTATVGRAPELRRPGAPAAVSAWSRQDLGMLLRLPVGAAIAWVVPERFWPHIGRAVASMRMRLRPEWAMAGEATIRRLVGDRPLPLQVETVLARHIAWQRLAQLQALRDRRPGGWNPEVRLEGRAHLERALAAGRGAILWVAPFAFAPLVSKIALHRAGFAASHLSRYSHGYSPTRLGARWLNPVRTGVEARYLAERIVVGPEGSTVGPMKALARRLRENRVVSIIVGAYGVRTESIPFLAGRIAVATGAPNLSVRTGAPLLPLFTLRQSGGDFITVIGPPLAPGTAGTRADAIRALIGAFAGELEDYLLRWPDQFIWGSTIVTAAASVPS